MGKKTIMEIDVDKWSSNKDISLCSLEAKGLLLEISIYIEGTRNNMLLVLSENKVASVDDFVELVSKIVSSDKNNIKRLLHELIERDLILLKGNVLKINSDFKVKRNFRKRKTTNRAFGKTKYIYLFKVEDENLFKVGITTNPPQLERQLRSRYKIKGHIAKQWESNNATYHSNNINLQYEFLLNENNFIVGSNVTDIIKNINKEIKSTDATSSR